MMNSTTSDIKLPTVQEAQALLAQSNTENPGYLHYEQDGSVRIDYFRNDNGAARICVDGTVTREHCLAMIVLMDAAQAKNNEL